MLKIRINLVSTVNNKHLRDFYTICFLRENAQRKRKKIKMFMSIYELI